MTESQAYEVAVAYLHKEGVTHYGCKDKGLWLSCNSLGLYSSDIPDGFRPKLWYFVFRLEEPPPPDSEVVICGGDYVVCVDDETGTSGHFCTL